MFFGNVCVVSMLCLILNFLGLCLILNFLDLCLILNFFDLNFEFSGGEKKTYSRVFKNTAIGPQPITTIINAA